MKRYFCQHPETGYLDEQESHHCLVVMRQKVDDFCTVFNGQGLEVKARIVSLDKHQVAFEKITETKTPKPPYQISLAQALIKSKSMDLIIQKATELGMAQLIPLVSDRSVPILDEEQAGLRLQKWRQITIEAAKQSGQNWLPEILPVVAPKTFFRQPREAEIKFIASLQPEARPLKSQLQEVLATAPASQNFLITIGPEGDFTPAEMGEARAAGFLPVSLGKIILRSETAALFTLSSLVYELGA